MFRLAVIAIPLLAASPALAEPDLTSIPQDAATLAISGTWAYETGDHASTGPCPDVPPKTGTLEITVADNAPVQLDVLTGELCGKPMHLMAGEIEWGNLVVGNAMAVDDEGGQVFNSMVAYFFADDHGSGLVRSLYTHPGGMHCGWSYRVELTRP